MHDETTYSYRQHFVNALIEQGVLHSLVLKQAFFAVPRDAFIESYYEQEGTSLVWTRIEAPGTNASKEQKDGWYRTIYSDRALVTQIDEQGRPISSSSMPSVMAMTLEALSIERGHRLLEIGSGTGYNAALLALVAGENQLVTTIEIDPELAFIAKLRLDHMEGPGINVIAGDGLHLSGDTLYVGLAYRHRGSMHWHLEDSWSWTCVEILQVDWCSFRKTLTGAQLAIFFPKRMLSLCLCVHTMDHSRVQPLNSTDQ
jgi:protein-L-isoaspartate O-methyltransferase